MIGSLEMLICFLFQGKIVSLISSPRLNITWKLIACFVLNIEKISFIINTHKKVVSYEICMKGVIYY
jgi:hypothetical protein